MNVAADGPTGWEVLDGGTMIACAGRVAAAELQVIAQRDRDDEVLFLLDPDIARHRGDGPSPFGPAR